MSTSTYSAFVLRFDGSKVHSSPWRTIGCVTRRSLECLYHAQGKTNGALAKTFGGIRNGLHLNIDETSLFQKLLPRKICVINEQFRKSLRVTKAMKSKDRIKTHVCKNADGTQKFPLAIIGKSRNQRCFRRGSPLFPYFSQKNAWSETVMFRKWF